MSNFHIGQKVVCVKRGAWVDSPGALPTKDPSYGDILTINNIQDTKEIGVLLYFVGYPAHVGYSSRRFQPLSETSIEEVIEKIEVLEYEKVLILPRTSR